MAKYTGLRHGTSEIVEKNAEMTILLLLIWLTAFILWSVQPGAVSLVISIESSLIKAVQIVDSNKITHTIRCAWNTSSMHAAPG